MKKKIAADCEKGKLTFYSKDRNAKIHLHQLIKSQKRVNLMIQERDLQLKKMTHYHSTEYGAAYRSIVLFDAGDRTYYRLGKLLETPLVEVARGSKLFIGSQYKPTVTIRPIVDADPSIMKFDFELSSKEVDGKTLWELPILDTPHYYEVIWHIDCMAQLSAGGCVVNSTQRLMAEFCLVPPEF